MTQGKPTIKKVVDGTPLFDQSPATEGGKPSRPLKPAEPITGRQAKPTDDELGQQLINRWDGAYAFMYGAWYRYERGVWKADEGAEIQFWQILIDNKINGIKPNNGKAMSVSKYCQLKQRVKEDEIDGALEYVNLANGLFNLHTFVLEPHRPELHLTSQLPFEYDESAKCPEWQLFLETVLTTSEGLPDHELIKLVQEAFYYSLTADTSYRVSFWCVGLSGTGKSTLVNVLLQLAGDSAVTIDLDSLKDNQYQVADIAGKRVVSFSEPDGRTPLADGWYKKLVSKDPISARQAYGKPFNFVPICKVWGSMNETPRVVDRSDAVYGRVIIIPMNNVIPHDQRDLELDRKLKAEIPGIFNWALDGGIRLRTRRHFTQARQSHEAREAFRMENDTEALFVSERCTLSPDLKTNNDDLYQHYKWWCQENGYIPKQKERVGRDWRRMGFEAGKSNGVRLWKGVGLIHVVSTSEKK